MHARRRVARRRQLLLGAGICLVVTATACGPGTLADATSARPDRSAHASPQDVGSTDRSPGAMEPESTGGGGRSLEHPSERVRSGGRPSDPALARTMSAATPVRLQVPAIGVDSGLIDLGLQTDGTLEVPPSGFPAGWYTGAPTPGELGPAIIAGHVDWGGRPGVFFDLRELTSGDAIVITRVGGGVARFRVTHVEQFAKDAFPTRAVYGDIDHAGLRLITCGGSFDRERRSYDDNLVVFAELEDAD